MVVGCGRVGSELAGSLEKSGHSVAVVDKRAAAFRRLPSTFNGQRVVGFGFDRDHLLEAGIERADAVAAVTSGDNSNILTARIARENFGIDRVVARIYDPRRAVIYERLGIPTVATVPWTTEQVMRRLFPAELATEWTDATGRLTLVERGLPPAWAGRALPTQIDDRVRVVAVTRDGKAQVLGPGVVGQEGDVLLLLASAEAVDRVDALIGGD